MTVVTRKFADITKRPDYYLFEFETGLRRSNEDEDVTITPKRIKKTPEDVDGEAVLSVDLDPGPARVTYRGVSFIIEIPESGPADLQDLIDAGTVENGAPEIPSNSVALRGRSFDGMQLDGTDLVGLVGDSEAGRVDLAPIIPSSNIDTMAGAGAAGKKLVKAATEMSARAAIGLDPVIVTDAAYGAVADAVALTDATMTAGSSVCTSASNKFTPSMVGQTIIIRAGTGQAPMTSTVASYQSAGQITLSDVAITNALVSGGPNVNAIIGTDNSQAFEDALATAAAKAAAAGSYTKRYQTVAQVYVPSGSYLTITGIPALQEPGISVVGAGPTATRIWHCGNDAFLQMGTFNATPSNAWEGIAGRLQVSDLELSAPIYANPSQEGTRVGIGIQDNGCGHLCIDNVWMSGFEYGVLAAYGSDFTTFGPNVALRHCDVGVYLGPGSEQILLHGVDFYMCGEGLVNEGAPQGALVGCSFEDNRIADITYDGNSSGTTRSGVPWNTPPAYYFGSWTHVGCWFETGAGGTTDRNNDHSIWIKSTAYDWVGWRGLSFTDCILVSGGRTQVPGGTNSFITDSGTQAANPLVDNLIVIGKSINGIYYYNGPAGTSDVALRNWHAVTPSNGIVAIIGETDLSTIYSPMTKLMTGRDITLDDVTLANSLLTSPRASTLLDTVYGNTVVNLVGVNNGVNYVELVNAIANSAVQVRPSGATLNTALWLRPRGTEKVRVVNGDAATVADFTGGSSHVNYWDFSSAAADNAITATVRTSSGSQPNVSANVVTRGNGTFQVNSSEVMTAKRTINPQTGTTYTLALTDAGHTITLNNASATTLTVPTNATAAFPVGASIELFQLGAGQVTVAGASGVTINSTPGQKISAQYGKAQLLKIAADTWVLTGSLSA